MTSSLFAGGIVFALSLNIFAEKFFRSNKSTFENKLSLLFGKNINLGQYSGLSLNGIVLKDVRIEDNYSKESRINAKKVYLGILPFKSIFNRKWTFNIEPAELNIHIRKDFFNKIKFSDKKSRLKKNKFEYDIYLKVKNKSNLIINEIGLSSKIKGDFLYKSERRQYIGVLNTLNTSENNKGNLKIKLNTNLEEGLFSFKVFSKGKNFKNLKYKLLNNQLKIKDVNLKSDFSFTKLQNRSICRGALFLNNIFLQSDSFSNDLNSERVDLVCENNKITLKTNNLKYGSLNSSINLDIPLKETVNSIKFNGELGYKDSIEPEVFINGKLPFWFDQRGLNFGAIESSFTVKRTQLSNLNFFRNNGIRGFITASGNINGNLDKPFTSIDFNIDYPHFKGIRIRESWEGNLNTKDKGLLLKMNNIYSPIPSFLSILLDSNFKLRNVFFSRIYNSNKGELNIIKQNNYYSWQANNFPLNELELSFVNNDFDRVQGIMNGKGKLFEDQSFFDGELQLRAGEYRNIKFDNSKFDFQLENKKLNIKSSLYPNDGGIIDVEYGQNNDDLLNIKFTNVSTNWTTLTAFDIYKFNNVNSKTSGSFKDLKNISILNKEKSLDEQLDFIEKVSNSEKLLSNKDNLNKYMSKFVGKYSGNLKITSNNKDNYNIKTKLIGYLKEKNSKNNNFNEKFSIDLQGGLLKGKGILKIKQIPLNLTNLFFRESKDFRGGLDLNLNYDLDKKSFVSTISSNKTAISDYKFELGKGNLGYNNSLLNVDVSLILNKTGTPIDIKGSIPVNTREEVDLRLTGDHKVFDLLDKLSNDRFLFNKGKANLRLKVNGKINQPVANGFLFIKDGKIDLFQNSFKDINSTIIFDFDQIEIVDFSARGIDNSKIYLNGALPFYKESKKDKKSLNISSKGFNLVGKNINLILDSNIFIERSFINPLISGNLSFKNGFIDFGVNNSVNNANKSIDKKVGIKNKSKWPELDWNRNANLEIISNESILNSNLFNDRFNKSFPKISFNDLKVNFGPEFRVGYGNIIKAYLITDRDLIINGNVIDNLSARGQVNIKRARANLYTTPFKQDKNKDNFIVFASRGGINPYINFTLLSKVPDTIIPINENNKNNYINIDQSTLNNSNSFGSFGIGNTKFIKIEASYKGFLDQLSFEDENQKIKLRSTPSYSRSQIIGLIGGNSANLINRAFISQLNSANAFSERFQLSLYPALIANNEPINNIFSNDNIDLESNPQSSNNEGISSQAWVAEVGLDISDRINFTIQTTPDRDDLPPLGILTFQANQYLELLGSFDSDGDWKSQVQLYWRFGD